VRKTIRRKVYVYCVDRGRLLVFSHTGRPSSDVGIQVPGGSIRDDEAPEAAALRELTEETGRGDFRIGRLVGQATYDITPYRPEIQERSFFLAHATGALPERWAAQESHDGHGPATPLSFFWIPLSAAHVLQAGQGALIGALTDEELTTTVP
jgi:8-oxo-dGTP pyrophosphatase MutT (NUDIX family)